MKTILYLSLLFGMLSCTGQETVIQQTFLSVSPIVDQTNPDNQILVSTLEKFLLSKNNSLIENEYWLESDFEKYVYPYADIFQIEKSRHGDNYFKPSLMELIDVGEEEKLLKIGFVGVHPETSERTIKCIYNMLAVKQGEDWKLKRAIAHQIKDWQVLKNNSITYYLPKHKPANKEEMKKQEIDIKLLCQFFETTTIPIKYFSCDNPKQVFELKGFDYLPNMYFSDKGGMADPGNIIYSGNDSEEYTHEIVHIYTNKLFPGVNKFLDEGIATYIGGSGGISYADNRKEMKEYLSSNNLNLAEHLEPYERLYLKNNTPVPYMTGALICERINRIYGKEKLFEVLKSDADLWTIFQTVNLTKDNLTEELKDELQRSLTMYNR